MTNTDWIIQSLPTPDDNLLEAVGGHPLVTRLLLQRGFDSPAKALAFLDPANYQPSAATELFGLAEAATLLLDAIRNEQNILVWGDFDVDGQTSTSLLVSGLRTIYDQEFPEKHKTKRHKNRVRFHVPNRFTESHGIKPDFLQKWLDDTSWQPQVLLTCDTGVTEDAAIGIAKDHGLTVIITDHHDLPEEFSNLTPGIDPLWGMDQNRQTASDVATSDVSASAASMPTVSVRRADAIVNPKFQPTTDPLRTLPGVGVAYKLMQHLFAIAGYAGQGDDLLDLVALGIVADVAEQVNDARYLLQRGLEALRSTTRVGLLALMDVTKITAAKVDEEDIGFQIGPRMNALGRLEDATDAVELLTTTDAVRARGLAAKLNRLNQERRLLTGQISTTAQEMIARQPDLLNHNGLVLAHPAWHPGIVGIVASHLAEKYNKPTVLLLTPPGEPARGSARSVDGVDIGGSIAACHHLLRTHGGHPGAAGLSLLPENIDAFRRELDRQIVLHSTDDVADGLQINAALQFDEISLPLLEQIQRLAPFGSGNPQPIFVSHGVNVVDDKRIGREQQHRKFFVQQTDGGQKIPVLWFNDGSNPLPPNPVDLAYTLSINEFRGERTVQMMYVGIRGADAPQDAPSIITTERITIHDLRFQPVALDALPTPSDDVLWYAEGVNLPDAVAFAPRTHSQNSGAAETLVLWSVPPSAQVLSTLLETVEPRVMYVCAQHESDSTLSSVVRAVGGMCKYALEKNAGSFDVPKASAKLGVTDESIRHSLRWLASKGLIEIVEMRAETDRVLVEAGNHQTDDNKLSTATAALTNQLDEIKAFRRFYRQAKIDDLGIE